MSATSVAHYYRPRAVYHSTRSNFIERSKRLFQDTIQGRRTTSEDTTPQRPVESSQKELRTSIVKSINEATWNAAKEKRSQRDATLKRFGALINDTFGNMYSVQPFGSTCYGASSNASDIDVVIFDNERPYGISPDDTRPLPPIYNVRRIAQCLRRAGYMDISFIPNAAVPLVKFTDPATGMSCDANVNNRLGVYNTALLRQYCLRVPHLARFLRSVKVWVRSVGLNNPSAHKLPRSFSSYAITLMTIAWMQDIGHLPNLQADPDVILESHFWEQRLGWNRKVEFSFGACKDWARPPYLRPPTFYRWLRFWAQEFDHEKSIVSIREGGFVDRPAEAPREWGHLHMDSRDVGNIVVLDPLSDRNCTYGISSAILNRFKQACAEEMTQWKEPHIPQAAEREK
ncbi:hypothetical protein C2E23DRAFT_840027 [Lenzites betulinus]|nr:hypothetical protein C2E23DRAFT_840027 [Lenzites betulinus]